MKKWITLSKKENILVYMLTRQDIKRQNRTTIKVSWNKSEFKCWEPEMVLPQFPCVKKLVVSEFVQEPVWMLCFWDVNIKNWVKAASSASRFGIIVCILLQRSDYLHIWWSQIPLNPFSQTPAVIKISLLEMCALNFYFLTIFGSHYYNPFLKKNGNVVYWSIFS